MDIFLALIMFCLCIFSLMQMYINKSVLWIMIGTIGCFSIGYYVLPVFFKQYSSLDSVNESKLNEVLLMCVVFFVSIVVGVVIKSNFINRKSKSLNLNILDSFFFSKRKYIFFLSYILWLAYYFTNDLTSYSSEDFEGYFHNRSIYSGVLAAISTFCLSVMSNCIALFKSSKSKWMYIYISCYSSVVLLLLVTGQRLSVITPLFMLVGAFSIHGHQDISFKIIRFAVVFLIFVSPLMVFIREYQGDRGKLNAIQAAKEYNSGDDALNEGFISIMKRADLLYVMTVLKNHYDDSDQFNQGQYLFSVFSAYIPKVLFPEKPYPLSDNGLMTGEISVQAWNLIIGPSTGSLSAFGSISAYREGGWGWVILNGLLTGFLFVWVYSYYAKGGYLSKILFISVFVTLTIKNVPLSLFYFLVYISPIIQITLLLKLLNNFLSSR